MCFVTGICDILILMNNNIGNVLPKACVAEGFYRFLGAPYLHLYFFIAWGGGVCQGFCATVIAFNRFFTLLYPKLSLKLYSKPLIFCSFGLQLIPGIIAGSITLTVKVSWWRNPTDITDCALVSWIENDICAGTNAYLLLAFSKPIRHHFIKLLNRVHPNIVKIRMDTHVPVTHVRSRSPATTIVRHN
uniref:7TM GPCR serpentine receptor class x (Srx) domain-containing protein n=1 Tax=Panagrolaimus sp. ES5 TaxID=591445 RepID=A0AC34GQK3_9BILA